MFVAYLLVVFLEHVDNDRLNLILRIILQLIRVKVFIKFGIGFDIYIKFANFFIDSIGNQTFFLLKSLQLFRVRRVDAAARRGGLTVVVMTAAVFTFILDNFLDIL